MRQLRITKEITNRESKSVDIYFNEVSKIPLLKQEEEVELTRKIKQGDQLALHKLVKSNLRFVVSVTKKYQNQGLSLSDLINEGNLGLIKAAQRFDETKGFKFISYAVWWIRQTINEAISEQSRIVRLPSNKVGLFSKISRVSSEFEQQNDREPTSLEIAELMNLSVFDIENALINSGKKVSIDSPITSDGEITLLDVISDSFVDSPDKGLNENSLKSEIKRSMSKLSYIESQVISMYFGINNNNPMTLEHIGEELCLTRERIRQIQHQALRKLRNKSKGGNLVNFL
jgi:RNA polymerase primary sigma factor